MKPLTLYPSHLVGSLVAKVVIPVKTGIQTIVVRHDLWIPTCVGMTRKG